MNVDRRATAQICIALLKECAEVGEISDESHVALEEVLKTMRNQEYWQLKNQSKHEGKNAPTDKQIAISRVALPALELAVEALDQGDYHTILDQLILAITTDGATPKEKSKGGLRKVRG